MDISDLLPFAVICAVTAVILKRYKPEFSLAVGILAVITVIASALSLLAPAVTLMSQLSSALPEGNEHLSVLLKCAGLSVLSETAANICTDCAETALSRTVTLAGRIAVLITALPVFYALANVALELMKL